MRLTLLMIFFGILILSGCTQLVESTAGELQVCLSKCNEVCQLVKANNTDLKGFNQIGLEKQQGSVSVYCECMCN